MALKDDSKACLKENFLLKNTNDISIYIKKNMYLEPVLYVDKQFFNEKINVLNKCNIENFVENIKSSNLFISNRKAPEGWAECIEQVFESIRRQK